MEKCGHVVGAHIAAGTAWFAIVDGDGSLLDDPVDRLEIKDNLPLPRALSEFQESTEHLLTRLGASQLVLVRAGSRGTPPSPTDSRRRGWIEASLMVAAYRAGVEFSDVTHDRLQKEYGCRPTEAGFPASAEERLGRTRPSRWKERSPAFAAALLQGASE